MRFAHDTGRKIQAFALAMINLIPTQTEMVKSGKSGLDKSVAKDITQYKQICVPTPLYPIVLPVCA
jgi:hypothetical protein